MFCLALTESDKRHCLNECDRFDFPEISSFFDALIEIPYRFRQVERFRPAIGGHELKSREALSALVDSLEDFDGVLQLQVENLDYRIRVFYELLARIGERVFFLAG